GKAGVGEFALTRAEPGEIEAQHRDAEPGQAFGDAFGGVDVLAAGEAMRKQRVGARLPGRAVEQRRQIVAVGTGKIEAFSRHALLLFSPRTRIAIRLWPAGNMNQRLLNLLALCCD